MDNQDKNQRLSVLSNNDKDIGSKDNVNDDKIELISVEIQNEENIQTMTQLDPKTYRAF